MCSLEYCKEECFLGLQASKSIGDNTLTSSTVSMFSSYFWRPRTHSPRELQQMVYILVNSTHGLLPLVTATFSDYQSDTLLTDALIFISHLTRIPPPHTDMGKPWTSLLENIKHLWHWRPFPSTFPTLLHLNKSAIFSLWIFRTIDP